MLSYDIMVNCWIKAVKQINVGRKKFVVPKKGTADYRKSKEFCLWSKEESFFR